MSNTAQHTPTPWHVVNGSLIKDELMPFDRDERDTVLVATTAGTATAEVAEANAAFIVRACNSHEQLVAVAKLARGLTNAIMQSSSKDAALVAEAAESLRRIDAALAAAEA